MDRITPHLWFDTQAREAAALYTSVFGGSRVGDITRYAEGEAPDTPGTVKHAALTLDGQEFAAMDSAHDHRFRFNEAISLMVHCTGQEEIDHFWDKLSADPDAERCGWLKDRYGVSWQIVPAILEQMMKSTDKEQVNRVTQAFLAMKKFDVAELERAFSG